MTFKSTEVTNESRDDTCQYNEPEDETQSIEEKVNALAEFHWSNMDQAQIIGAFYLGYPITHLPGGVLADIYGPKKVLGYGVLVTVLLTLLTPVTARMGVHALTVLRVVLGLSQGPLFPAITCFIAHWALPDDRYMMTAYTNGGITFGAVIASSVAGIMMHNFQSWEIVFYVFGVITLVWYILWLLLAYDSPSKHPFITTAEKEELINGLKHEIGQGKPRIPYRAILTSLKVWVMVFAGAANDWAFYIILSLLPQYMSYVLHFEVDDNGLINSLSYISSTVTSLVAAWVAKVMVSRGWTSATLQNKLFLILTNMGPCIIFLCASYAGCQRVLVAVLFVVASSLFGIVFASIRVTTIDLAPNFSATLMSLTNGVGAITGILAPLVFALFTEENRVETWRIGFFVSIAVVTVPTITFLIWGTSEVQSWNFFESAQQQPSIDRPSAERENL